MNLTETSGYVRWLNTVDQRIQLSDANVQIWQNSLAPFGLEEVREATLEYYRLNETVLPTPGSIRRIAIGVRERATAHREALEAGPGGIKPDVDHDEFYLKRSQSPKFLLMFEAGQREGRSERAYNETMRRTGSQTEARAAALEAGKEAA